MGRISELIDRYTERNCDRYHTPGHHGVFSMRDVTELGYRGEIFPSDAVTAAEKATASAYSVAHMRFLTGGSSMGIKAALSAYAHRKVLYSNGVHRAFTEAVRLWDIEAVPITEANRGRVYNYDGKDIPLPVSAKETDAALEKNKDAAAVFVTSPDYLGRTVDEEIVNACRAHGADIIVDAAHGAHFAFAPGLGEYRLENKADAANMSAHKTLGAYTQSALLSVNKRELIEKVDDALTLLGTTSPNYELFARLEDCVAEAETHAKEYLRLKKFAKEISDAADCLRNVDYTRLCVRKKGRSGRETFAEFVGRKIMPEAAIGEWAVFILTPYDTDEKLGRLLDAAKKP